MLPFSSRLSVSNVTMVNFDKKGCVAFGTCAHCKPDDGGAIVKLNKLKFVSAPNIAKFPFNHASVLYDEDGSITGHTGGRILPYMDILDPAHCTEDASASFGVKGAVCSKGDFTRIAWNKVKPSSIEGKNAHLCNDFGCDLVKFRHKSKTHAFGYTALLPLDETLTLKFFNSSHLTNVTYSMGVYELPPNGSAYLKHSFSQTPDFFTTTTNLLNNTGVLPDPAINPHGAWLFEQGARNLTYMVKGEGTDPLAPAVQNINLNVYRCFFDKCETPTPPPPPGGRPGGTRNWDDFRDWDGATKGKFLCINSFIVGL